jgi:hypothetical protein
MTPCPCSNNAGLSGLFDQMDWKKGMLLALAAVGLYLLLDKLNRRRKVKAIYRRLGVSR